MSVTITTTSTTLSVSSPYHPDFAPAAKRLNGRWDSSARAWTFDPRDEERVRTLCKKIYGTDGTAPDGPLMTVRLTATREHWAQGKGIYFAGRCLAYATGRDSGAKLGEGVVLLAGRAKSGGSVKNWGTEITEGSILEVRDLPVQRLTAAMREGWKVRRLNVEVETARTALEEEKSRLLARIAQIEAQLQSLDADTDAAEENEESAAAGE